MRNQPEPTLAVSDLHVTYDVAGSAVPALRGVSFEISPRESYGLVGESGSGKSTVAFAVSSALPPNGRLAGGSISISGVEMSGLDRRELRRLRARRVSMVYQHPRSALNPSLRVGRQVAEAFEVLGIDRASAMARAEEMLAKVQISSPKMVMQRYPHQLSGGMAQRVVIAMALACDPRLLILDEPTTALDVTVEAEILDLVSALRHEMETSILFISHNLAVVSKMCDRVGVLYAGELLEEAPASAVFKSPRNPYTVGLLRCLPAAFRPKAVGPLETIPGVPPDPRSLPVGCVFSDRCGLVADRCRQSRPPLFEVGFDQNGFPDRWSRCFFHEIADQLPRERPVPEAPVPVVETTKRQPSGQEPLIAMRSISKTFKLSSERVHALCEVDLELFEGETLGVVGESGSGKTTLARVMLGLIEPDEGGEVTLRGTKLAGRAARRSRSQLKAIQVVFQDPDSALNRRQTVGRIVGLSVLRLGTRAADAAGTVGPASASRSARSHSASPARLRLHSEPVRARVRELLHAVRMEDRHLGLRPSQLSGGLKQRVAIARAFGGQPEVVVCDEPTSALDVSVQAAIVNVLASLQEHDRVSYLFISHDLAVVRYLADRIAVMYLGRLMEVGATEQVLSPGQHPYTEALFSAAVTMDSAGTAARPRTRLTGEIPSPSRPPTGCVFHTRCPRRLASGICESERPGLAEVEPGHLVACHIPFSERRRAQQGPLP